MLGTDNSCLTKLMNGLTYFGQFVDQRANLMLRPLKKLRCNYQHKNEVYQSFLISQYLQAYGFIPIIGPVLSVFASFLNAPSLIQFGCYTGYVAYIVNIVHFFIILIALLLFVFAPKLNPLSWTLVVIFFLLAMFDSFEESCELMPSYRRIVLNDLKKIPQKSLAENKYMREVTETNKNITDVPIVETDL